MDTGLQIITTGEAAIQVLSMPFMPDLMILDLNLPRMDEIQVLWTLQTLPISHALPIIIFSSYPRT